MMRNAVCESESGNTMLLHRNQFTRVPVDQIDIRKTPKSELQLTSIKDATVELVTDNLANLCYSNGAYVLCILDLNI